MQKKCLVIGYGSIGKRHADVLAAMGCDVSIVSRHAPGTERYFVYRSVAEAFVSHGYDYVVIANATVNHSETLRDIVPHLSDETVCFIEKPLFASIEQFVDWGNKKAVCGYVLRSHPLLRRMKNILQGKKLYSCRACCGQYLPSWRPDTDYTKCYSAKKEEGGGVLRDLSHELDYMQMLCGTWKRVTAIGGKFSDLQISSDDQFGILFETERCPLCICQIDYLSRNVHRNIFVEYENGSLHLDFIAGKLIHNGAEESVTLERNDLFTTMHKELMNYDLTYFSNAHDAYETVKFLDAAEKAAERNLWINNL